MMPTVVVWGDEARIIREDSMGNPIVVPVDKEELPALLRQLREAADELDVAEEGNQDV